ncbi:MAG: ribonuclease PH [Alphaproteobacteria bacterium]|nr:ribonuclease PH [Alphaproteobacteria bacterium]MBO4643738.1 ribonuclease PH [Alphaproteobacteria bacterium]
MERPSKRQPDELRKVTIEPNVNKHAEGSCLIKCGDTHVICTATVEDKVPMWMRNTGRGWVTAEYGMIPRATGVRTDREAKKGQSGRTQEIQRLIGRALRSVVDLKALGEICIKIDCDVIQADGGTRTASITGGYVALHLALQKLREQRRFYTLPLFDTVSAISCGIYEGTPVLDLDYTEDSNAQTDSNFVITGKGGIVEIQGTAERTPFTPDEFKRLYELACKGTTELSKLQHEVLGE